MKRLLKYVSFSVLGVVILLLTVATVLEKFYGTAFVTDNIYTSVPVIMLWFLLAVAAFIYLIKCKVHRTVVTFALHLSFLLILCGALVTHLTGVQGSVHLRTDAPATTVYSLQDGNLGRFPFLLKLNDFTLEYYKGTFAPMDYVSTLMITENADSISGTVSMNNIFSYKGYRFYQSGYDDDGKGATLSVAYDPYGISITYIGYAMLLLSMSCFFFVRRSSFRSLLRSPLLKRGTLLVVLFFLSVKIYSNDAPATLPHYVAEELGNLYIYYNDRISPLQTFAKDFTVKLYGKSSYKGLSPEQVVAGWFFYYDDWKYEPMIKVKEKAVRDILGCEGKYASLVDFTSNRGYKLDAALQSSDDAALRRAAASANEKFNLVSMLCTGRFLQIFPYSNDSVSTPQWYSLADRLPADMPVEQYAFVRGCMNYVAEKIAAGRYDEAVQLLGKIRKYQKNVMGALSPSDMRFSAEKLYNNANCIRFLAMFSVFAGVVSFFICIRSFAKHKPIATWLRMLLNVLRWAVLLYLTFFMALRGYISGHFPVSNGFETMMFMAWCVLLISILANRRFVLAAPFGLLLCGLSLMVAMMGDSNPQITQLMPVLHSPLLSVHVVVIMIAYSLFAFAMLNGVTALFLHRSKENSDSVEYLAVLSRIILYPAVFLLAVGIFIGAVWANVSWGRYWGWDPKEVWALITMLVYSLALHATSLPMFRKPLFLHLFCIAAFLTVLITYFGVNFILGGMHSYA